jgi:imidazole glycerol-phosphate synthase subunit HisF
LIKRILSRIDIKNTFLVKGVHLEGLRVFGYPEFFAQKYYNENIDEIIFQDVVASLYKKNNLPSLIKRISENVFIPITCGGGISNIDNISELLINGADRVLINTGAVNNIKFVKDAVKTFGSSTITVGVETQKIDNKYKVFTESGRTKNDIDTFEWIKKLQDIGVGEIVLSSISKEGTGEGFDLDLNEKASNICKISLLAHGGAGKKEDVYELFNKTDVNGVVIAAAFHHNYFSELLNKKKIIEHGGTSYLYSKKFINKFSLNIKELKEYLKSKKMNIR